jgi:hypothetical protein
MWRVLEGGGIGYIVRRVIVWQEVFPMTVIGADPLLNSIENEFGGL